MGGRRADERDEMNLESNGGKLVRKERGGSDRDSHAWVLSGKIEIAGIAVY